MRMVDVSPIDEDFGVLERQDASMDRTVKRLMQLKTMKQMFCGLGPKMIPTSQTKSEVVIVYNTIFSSVYF